MPSVLSTYTKEELQKKLKSQKSIAIIHGFIVVLLFVISIYKTVEEGMSFSSFLPLFFVPMQVVIMIEIKKLKKELASRK